MQYLIDNTVAINTAVTTIIDKSKHKDSIQIPFTSIPVDLIEYADPLNAISEFTSIVEGDFSFQQHLYKAYLKAKTELQDMIELENHFAEILLDLIIKRFESTAKWPITELAYYLTPEGANQWRSKYTPFFITARQTHHKEEEEEEEEINEEAQAATDCKMRMTQVLIILSQSIMQFHDEKTTPKKQNKNFVNSVQVEFNTWLNIFDLPNPKYNEHIFWNEMKNNTKLQHLAEIAEVVVSMLASEAVVERLFSMAKNEVTKSNGHMKLDLFRAMTVIKLCSHYKELYPE